MRVLVTGGAGYIGSHAVLDLLDHGHQVWVIDDLSTGDAALVDPRAGFLNCCVSDQRQVGGLLKENGIDTVMHFAASVVVSESVSDPLKYYLNNTVRTHSLLQTAADCGTRHFVFSSTAAVYGNAGNEPIREDAPIRPLSPYGTSKHMSELMLQDAAPACGMSYVVLRYFNVAGADPLGRSGQASRNATHLIKVACEVAAGRQDVLRIYGNDYDTRDGTGLRDYVHVSDIASAHRLAMEYLCKDGRSTILNCGSSEGHTVREVVDAVCRVSGKPVPIEFAPRRPGDCAALVADNRRILETFGWKPANSDLDLIVRNALDWEKRILAG